MKGHSGITFLPKRHVPEAGEGELNFCLGAVGVLEDKSQKHKIRHKRLRRREILFSATVEYLSS